jgi:hypothetical protein
LFNPYFGSIGSITACFGSISGVCAPFRSPVRYDEASFFAGYGRKVDVVQPAKADGTQEVWGFETGSTGMLARSGWGAYDMKPGDKVTATYSPEREGKPIGLLMEVKLPSGRILAGGGVPPPDAGALPPGAGALPPGAGALPPGAYPPPGAPSTR